MDGVGRGGGRPEWLRPRLWLRVMPMQTVECRMRGLSAAAVTEEALFCEGWVVFSTYVLDRMLPRSIPKSRSSSCAWSPPSDPP
jgi:hypothetical protein